MFCLNKLVNNLFVSGCYSFPDCPVLTHLFLKVANNQIIYLHLAVCSSEKVKLNIYIYIKQLVHEDM